jgi:nucleotide-binding universal stress UspA family protein
MFRIRRILFPTDFSKYSLDTLDTAIDIAKRFRASLVLLHVVEDLPLTQHPTVSVASVEEILKDMEKRAREKLRKTIGPKIRKRVPATYVVTRGTPFLEVLRVARSKKADLIILTTHGRTGLSHLLMGSTAEKVVRKSSCPVLTIRPPQHRFKMP